MTETCFPSSTDSGMDIDGEDDFMDFTNSNDSHVTFPDSICDYNENCFLYKHIQGLKFCCCSIFKNLELGFKTQMVHGSLLICSNTKNLAAVMRTRGVICQKEMVIQIGGLVSESFIVIFSVINGCQQHNWGEEKKCPLVFVSSCLNM